MDKIMKHPSEEKTGKRLSDNHLDAVTGGFVIYGAEATGFIIDGGAYACQNNLHQAALPAVQNSKR